MTKFQKLANDFVEKESFEIDTTDGFTAPAIGSDFADKLAALLEAVAVNEVMTKDDHGHWSGCNLPLDHEGGCVVLFPRQR
jgi:hypothetical protein